MGAEPAITDWISSVGPLLLGGGAALAGLLTYQHKRNKELLTEIVTPVLKEYNELKAADIAIDILNDFPYKFEEADDAQAFKLYGGSPGKEAKIGKKDLPLVLRDDRWVDTSKEEETVVRSFDALLFFFSELEYIVNLGLLKHEQLTLFDFETKAAFASPAIVNFIKIHKLPIAELIPESARIPKATRIVGDKAQELKRLLEARYDESKDYNYLD